MTPLALSIALNAILLANFAALLVMQLRQRRRLREIEGLLAILQGLPSPHRKAVETRRAARIEAMRRHRLALAASMQSEAAK